MTRLLNVTDLVCESIAQHCTNITSLAISRCPRVTDKGLSLLFSKLRNLEVVGVQTLSALNDVCLKQLEVLHIIFRLSLHTAAIPLLCLSHVKVSDPLYPIYVVFVVRVFYKFVCLVCACVGCNYISVPLALWVHVRVCLTCL